MRFAKQRWLTIGLALALGAGCATGRAMRNAQTAADAGDYDTAVAYYREALSNEPGSVDIQIALERATRQASAAHIDRARDLEERDQLGGAIAEYRLAAELDPSNTLAVTRGAELERRLREQLEASREPTGIEALREQAAELVSPVPRLDPRDPVGLRFNGALRDLMATIRDTTNINITYDSGLDPILSRQYELNVQDMSVENVLTQALQANVLTFKVTDRNTIFVYQDNAAKRQQWDDVYAQTFYLSHADASDVNQMLNQMVTQGVVVRPAIAVNKNLNAIQVKATYPVLQFIEAMIRANDKPRAEVMVEAQILEVNRLRLRELGLDLNQYALGLTFSPEVAPPNTGGTFPPGTPPPFNLNTISQGVSAADFYVTPLTAVINMLERETSTKVLAKTNLRGMEGSPLSLNLGDLVPIPQTVFQSSAAGGLANLPTTQVQYQSVGVNLLFTPRVTFENEIILESLTLEKSGLGSFIEVGGQSFPTIVTRNAQSTLRLRDGEPNMLAGLLSESDRQALSGLPGLSNVPIIRSIFGSTERQVDQTDLIMILTPRIVRSHDLSVADLQPTYAGTFQNLGVSRAPQLIDPNAPPTGRGGGGVLPPGGGVPPVTPPTPPVTQPPPDDELVPIRPPAARPIEVEAAPASATQPQISLTVGGEQQVDGLFTVPVSLSNVEDVGTVSVTITYDPALLQAASVTPGSFMVLDGVAPAFVPSIDAQRGRIDLAITQPSALGVSGSGLVAGVLFKAMAPGTAQLVLTAVVTTPGGEAVTVRPVPAVVIVR